MSNWFRALWILPVLVTAACGGGGGRWRRRRAASEQGPDRELRVHLLRPLVQPEQHQH
jgi:hypothetical protein